MGQLADFYKGKRVLVTGHTGFKGAWLAHILSLWGANVSGIALQPHTNPNLFEVLSIQENIENNFVDIREPEKVKKIIQQYKPEIVFHLAAQAIVRESYDHPLLTHATNILGTAHIIESIRETETVKSAVIITTDKVYDDTGRDHAYKETDALGGHDPYSASKAATDIVTQSYISSYFPFDQFNSQHETLFAIARAGNVIGGGDWASDRIVPDIIRAVFESGKKVTIRNPKYIRPWEHVLEPVSGYLILGKKLHEGEKRAAGAWNFGPDESCFISVEELVQRILRLLNHENEYLIQEDATKPEAEILKLDVSKLKTQLGIETILDLHNNFQYTAEWYTEYYNNPKNIGDFTNIQIEKFFSQRDA